MLLKTTTGFAVLTNNNLIKVLNIKKNLDVKAENL